MVKKFIFSVVLFVCATAFASAQETSVSEPVAIAADMCKNDEAFSQYLEKLAQNYFSKDDYDGLYQFLGNSLKEGSCGASAEIYYYRALSRRMEIASWQKTKNWEGVYDKASEYKKEIIENLDKAKGLVKDGSLLSLNISYLRWRNMYEEDSTGAGDIFKAMLSEADNLKSSFASLERIKSIGDELSSYEDKNLSRQFYDLYIKKLEGSALTNEELKALGNKFLAESNLYLSKTIFDLYLTKISPTAGGQAEDKSLYSKESIEIADKFAYQDNGDAIDPVYAEVLYGKAFDIGGLTSFGASSQYRRAFNQERLKEYQAAVEQYKNFITGFSDSVDKDKIYFRMGVLTAYGLKDIETAFTYFSNSSTISSLYQQGLLSQWKNDLVKAEGFYNAALEKAKTQGLDLEKNEMVKMIQERLAEIKDKKEIKYGLKLFLDGIFSPIFANASSLTIDLTANPPKAGLAKLIHFVVTTSNPSTGCMVPVYAYEWSGETGMTVNVPNAPELNTDYSDAGVKVTHVAVISSKGLEGVGFDMVEII